MLSAVRSVGLLVVLLTSSSHFMLKTVKGKARRQNRTKRGAKAKIQQKIKEKK